LHLRRRYQLIALGEGVAALLLALCVLFVAQAFLDWFFEIPRWVRLIFLIGDTALLAFLYRRVLRAHLWRNLNLANTALLAERRWPELDQCLITAVELAEGNGYTTCGSPELAEQVFQHARFRADSIDFDDAAPSLTLKRRAALALAAFVFAGALAAVTLPLSGILVQRIFLSNKPLPTRTTVESITRDILTPAGVDLELIARAHGEPTTRGRIVLQYDKAPIEEISLTPKGDVFSYKLTNIQKGFRYTFHLGDGKSAQYRVEIRIPPVVAALVLEQIPPKYTKLPPQQHTPSDLSLHAGSRLNVTLTSSTPLRAASLVPHGADAQPLPLKVNGTNASGTFAIPAKELNGLSLHLVDREGVTSTNETVYPVTLIPDNPPEIHETGLQDERQTITLKAQVEVAFSATDEFGLAAVKIVCQMLPSALSAQTTTATTAPDDASAKDLKTIALKVNAPGAGTAYRHILDLPSIESALATGWTVNYWIEAEDNNDVTGPGVTKTKVRQLRIVTPAEKQAEILERIKQNADAMENLSGTQQKVSTEIGETIKQ
jgi:hypothetical protein